MIKKLTIDDLARMTQDEFSSLRTEMDRRFDDVDRRFDHLEAGQARLEQGVKSVLAAVLDLPSKKTMDARIEKIEQKLAAR